MPNEPTLQAITEIDLDISLPVLSIVHAKQYDTVRQVKAHLFDSGRRWYVPESNYVAVVAFKKDRNVGGFYDHTEEGLTAVVPDHEDGSTIYILLDRHLLTKAGDVYTEITFYDSITNGRLSTFNFTVQVEEASVTELDLSNNSYFNVLAEEIREVLQASTQVESIKGLTATAVKVAPGASDVSPVVTGGPDYDLPFNVEFKIPTFAGMTASSQALAPGSTPTAVLSGGTSGTQKYNVQFGIPTFPGVQISGTVSRLAPGDTPTVTQTGGSSASTPYTLAFGIPTFPGLNVSASGLAAGSDPTATLSGGTTGSDIYRLALGIPKGDKGDKGDQTFPTGISYRYANSSNYSAPPSPSSSDWSSTPSPETAKYLWSEATITWDNNETSVIYSVGYIGANGTGSTAAEVVASSGLTVQEELNNKVLRITGTIGSLPMTITSSAITENHVVAEMGIGTPAAQASDWTVTTSTGQAVITGSLSGTTTFSLVLVKATSSVIT